MFLGGVRGKGGSRRQVVHSVAEYLDTDVDKGLPGSAEGIGELRNTVGDSNQIGEAFRQIQVQLKINRIDSVKERVSLETLQALTRMY